LTTHKEFIVEVIDITEMDAKLLEKVIVEAFRSYFVGLELHMLAKFA
jgi:hypothetical protein